MEYRKLTGTGITVSRASLGTMTFGKETDEAAAIRMVHQALDAGVNWVDTADVYTQGRSEEIVGKALLGRRHDVVLATKVANFSGTNRMRDAGLHRRHIIEGVEQSLKRLQTDYLDIYYMHRPDYATPIEETLAAFDTLVQQGKVVYVGMSNYASWQLCEAVLLSVLRGWSSPVVTQVPYNLVTRSIDEECVPFCQEYGMGITVYNPLAGGLLTGKHRRGAPPAKATRLADNAGYHGRYWSKANFDALERLDQLAKSVGKSLIELALQWLSSQPHVDSVLLGARTPEHLASNLQALDGRLEGETLDACDDVWAEIRGTHFSYHR